MAVVNEFLEFATSQYAYVESLQDYTADPDRTEGQQSGIARANLNNRALRQGSAMAAAIGGFMAKQGYNAKDDGLTDKRRDDFERAILKLIQPSVEVAINAAKINILQQVFPIGSFYFSYNTVTNPASRLGFGTWVKVEGRFLLGAQQGTYNAGSVGGTATHTLTAAQMPVHSHGGELSYSGEHRHNSTCQDGGEHSHEGRTNSGGSHSHEGRAENAGGHSHTRGTMEITGAIRATDNSGGDIFATGAFTGENVGSGDEGNHGGELKKYSFTASRTWTGSTSTAGAHTHDLNITHGGSHSHTLSIEDGGRHAHSITVSKDGKHTHTVTIKNAGSGRSFSIMPPYQAIYIWRRTA